MGVIGRIKSIFSRQAIPVANIGGDHFLSPIVSDLFNGDKYPGSFGITKDYYWVDYWTLRARSAQLFRDNPYCRGAVSRLLKNEINNGLKLEAIPIAELIGMEEDAAQEWGDQREVEFRIWGNAPDLCDHRKQRTLGALANKCREISMISGDCLVVHRVNKATGLPSVELVDGAHIQTPIGAKPRAGNRIIHGVEINGQGRHIAYHVKTDKASAGDNGFVRIPVRGEKSGRRISKLIYGNDDYRLDEVRGIPILASMLYMMRELDRYRDSEQRAATLNSILSLFITKAKPTGPGTQPFGSGARRNDTAEVSQSDGSTKNYNLAGMYPGLVLDELAEGEEPHSFNAQRPNVNYAAFEEAILDVLAWVNNMPPEVLRMKFQNNFSASRQANNEFQIYLWYQITRFGADFYQPIYQEYLIQSTLTGQVIAPGLIDAWRDPSKWREFGAWVNAEWTGISRPSVDILKDVKAWLELYNSDLTTGDLITRKFSGMSIEAVVRKRKREKEFRQKTIGDSEPEQTQEETPPQNENEVFSKKLVALTERVEDLEDKEEDKQASGS
jgi:lambda family phage portal protein